MFKVIVWLDLVLKMVIINKEVYIYVMFCEIVKDEVIYSVKNLLGL